MSTLLTGVPRARPSAAVAARPVRSLGAAVVGCLLLVCAVAPTASAHVILAGSNPADGQVLAQSPSQLRLEFSESVVLAATHIDVVDGAGRPVAVAHLRVLEGTAPVAGDGETPVEVVADLPPLARNTYRVTWQTLSTDDRHRASGALAFSVQHAVAAAGVREPTPRADDVALRWLVLLGLALSLGGSLTSRLLRRVSAPAEQAAVRQADSVALAGAMLAMVVSAGVLVDQSLSGGEPLGHLLGGSYGLRWGLREAGLLLLGLTAWARVRSGTGRAGSAALAVGASLACLGTALLGHSAEGLSPSRLGAAAAHVAAGATWAGSLVVMAVVLGLSARGRGGRPAAAEVLRRFGAAAAACVGVLAVTGLYLSSSVVGSVDAALLTVYGRVLVLKVALVGVAALLGLTHHRRLRRPGARPPRRSVVVEGAVLVAVVGLTAVLTSGQPAVDPRLLHAAVVSTAPLGAILRAASGVLLVLLALAVLLRKDGAGVRLGRRLGERPHPRWSRSAEATRRP